MAEFSGKVVSAFYIDEGREDIKIRYEQDGLLHIYVIPNDPEHAEYQELMAEGWDHERILDDTAERLRAESKAFNLQVNAVAKDLAREMLGMNVLQQQKEELEKEVSDKESTLLNLDKQVKVKSNEVDTGFFQILWDDNENKEDLFKFKLWALELDVVKNADKSVKTSIRKATRITQGLAIIDELIQ